MASLDRKSTRLNSSHTVIYTLSLHDGSSDLESGVTFESKRLRILPSLPITNLVKFQPMLPGNGESRSEEHTSELQSHSDLHSFPTRRLFRSRIRRHL